MISSILSVIGVPRYENDKEPSHKVRCNGQALRIESREAQLVNQLCLKANEYFLASGFSNKIIKKKGFLLLEENRILLLRPYSKCVCKYSNT